MYLEHSVFYIFWYEEMYFFNLRYRKVYTYSFFLKKEELLVRSFTDSLIKF